MNISIIISAVIITYFGSRLAGWAIRANRAVWRLLCAHLICLGVFAIVLGLVKSNPYQPFVYEAALPLLLPQLLWLGFDFLRRPQLA